MLTFRISMLISLILALLLTICVPGTAQIPTPSTELQVPPELVVQNSGGLGEGVQTVFGPNQQWLATSGAEGDVFVYDLAGGRVSHRFESIVGEALLGAHPKENLLAVLSRQGTGSVLQIYNVTTGLVAWKVPVNSWCGALRFSEDGSRVLGVCSEKEANAKTLIAQGSLRGWDTASGVEVQLPTLPDGYVAGNIFSEGGHWVIASQRIPDSMGSDGKLVRNPFQAIKLYRQFSRAMQHRSVIDVATGKIVAHISAFALVGISAHAHTAIVVGLTTRSMELLLIDLLNPSARPIAVNAPLSFNIQTTVDGRRYVLFSPGTVTLVDATTGQAWRAPLRDVPYLGGCALASDGDTIAFAQSGSVMTTRISQPSERHQIGSSQVELLVSDGSGRVVPGPSARPPQEDTAEAVPPSKPVEIPASVPTKSSSASLTLPTMSSGLKSFALDTLQNMIPVYGGFRQNRKDKAEAKEQDDMNSRMPSAPDEEQLKQVMAKSVLKFGGPIVTPPEIEFVNADRLMAVRTADNSWGLWDVATGNHISVRNDVPIDLSRVNNLSVWMSFSKLSDVEKSFGIASSVKPATDTPLRAVSSDGAQIFTQTNSNTVDLDKVGDRGEDAVYGLRVSDAATGKTMFDIPEVIGYANWLELAPGGHVLVGPDHFKTLGFWDRKTGERVATLSPYQEGEWLLTTPSGLFDGSPRGWQQIAWRDPGGGNATLPGEAFFGEFYHPGLLAELLAGQVPHPVRTLAQLDRRQPLVHLTAEETLTSRKTAIIHLKLTEASGSDRPGGLRDVRLFRNDVLVHAWRGELKLESGETTLTAAVPLIAGENRFVAYAFNRDNIKSLDEKILVNCTAPVSPRTVYILAIGINRYSNEEFNLNFAVPDATHFSEVLARSLKGVDIGERIVRVNLLDENATKDNVDRAIHILNGQGAPETVPSLLSDLRPTQPEDTVFVYFAGHGLASRDHFYLIPYDLGFVGPRPKLAGAVKEVLSHGISDIELESWLDYLDAANIVLVIDACSSGKVLDADEARRGPMNNRGLAQLAYEKGMYVLTASQAYQAALETSRFGHGYLTYALTDEGLETMQADTAPIDGNVNLVEWFEYAARRVPEMQNETLNLPVTPNGRKMTFEPWSETTDRGSTVTSIAGRLQTPRVYYRREQGSPLIVKTQSPSR